MPQSIPVLKFVEARVREIGTLHAEIDAQIQSKKKTWFQRLPHHLRRRQASQNPKKVPRKLKGEQQPHAKASAKSKRYKKQPKSRQEEYAGRSKPDCTWLETHIWHAKRFKMDTLWGYRLPIRANDKKIGLTHRAATNRVIIQDLSYYCCIELHGIQEKLLEKLSLLTNNAAGHTFSSEMFLDGSMEGQAFLYRPNCFPYGGIGGVPFMWRPVFNFQNQKYKSKVSGGDMRQLWIWCHPSIHDEIVQALTTVFDLKNEHPSSVDNNDSEMNIVPEDSKENSEAVPFACKTTFVKTKQHFQKEKKFVADGVRMVLLKNTMVRHRLIGPISQTKLAEVLNPLDVNGIVSLADESDNTETVPSAKKMKMSSNQNDDAISGCDNAISADSKQLWWESYYSKDVFKSHHSEKVKWLNSLRDVQSSHYITPRSIVGITVRDPRFPVALKVEGKNGGSESNFHKYVDFHKCLTAEVADSPIWEEEVRHQVTATKMSDKEINDERSNHIGTPDLGRRENKIPILLVQQSGLNGFKSGWDLIAPLGWSLEFWNALVKRACIPTALRDLHFINMEAACPSFPCSFPDTAAGSAYEEKLKKDSLKDYHRRPSSKRPNFSSLGIGTPFYIDWKVLVKDWTEELRRPEISQLFTTVENLLPADAVDEDKFFVLRALPISSIGFFTKSLNKNSQVSPRLDSLKKEFDSLLTSLPRELDLGRSLLLTKVRCVSKGNPSKHARIYLLSDADIEELKNNPKYCGPTEPNHPTEKQQPKDMPKIQSLVSNSARKMIGYISEGGFSSLCGQGCALGHCSAIGYLVMLKMCLEARLKAMVLVKDQDSFKYRVSFIDIIEDYL